MTKYKYYTYSIGPSQVWRWDVDQDVLTYIGTTRVRRVSIWSRADLEGDSGTVPLALEDVPEWAL